MNEQMQTQQELEQDTILPEGYAPEDDYFEAESWGKGGQPEQPDAAEQEAPAAQDTPPARDFQREATQFYAGHPDLNGSQMPLSVLNAWLGGAGLGEAYAQFVSGKNRSEAQRLARENQVLRQNADAAMRAPVRGVNGGGDTRPEPEDPFLSGFNDERW